jgi:DNA-directed RNA polymerase specialized sigma24 family protein
MDLDDMVQETLLQVVADAKDLPELSLEQLRQRVYLHVRYLVYGGRRKGLKREVPARMDLDATNFEYDAEATRKLMEEITLRLSSDDRVVLRLMAEGRSTRQLAAELGISRAAAAERYSRAIQRIRKTAEESGILERWHLGAIPKQKQFSIIVDSSVDSDLLARFLSELAALYSELTGGDELIIKEGKVRAGAGVVV